MLQMRSQDPRQFPSVLLCCFRVILEVQSVARESRHESLRRVANEHLAVNDEELEVPSEWDDLDFSSKGDAVAANGGLSVGQTANTVEYAWDVSPLPLEAAQQAGILSDDELKALEAQLWFPEERTSQVDAIADRFEVQRLIRKRVLKCAGLRGEVSEEGFKRLSTKFVRTWRKKVKGGVEMVLRRSRLCAREYKWLEADRLDIFSPASNTAVSKLLPWLFARMKNAEKVRASMPRDYSDQFEYDFEMCIPGQRDGALRWRERLINYLRTKFEVKVCEACPALISIDGQNCLLHVDDLFIVGKRSWLLKHFVPALEKEFECSWTIASEEGESVSFLKRTHRVTESGVIVQAQSDLIHKMCEVLGLHERKTSAVPCSKDILKVSGSKLLDAEGGSTFRTAIGIAMYLSNDRVDCAFPIRTLAPRLTAPTEDDLKAARKLAAYLRRAAGFGIHIVPREKGYSFLDQGPSRDQHEHLLEVCSVSDWSGSQAACSASVSAELGDSASADDDDWLFVGSHPWRPGRAAMVTMWACIGLLMLFTLGFYLLSLGSVLWFGDEPITTIASAMSVHAMLEQSSVECYCACDAETRDTTSATKLTIFSCCVSALLMWLLWQYMVQARRLGELERRCKALLDDRSNDRNQLKELRDEARRLSTENALAQRAYYELDHSRGTEARVVSRIPQEICVSAHGAEVWSLDYCVFELGVSFMDVATGAAQPAKGKAAQAKGAEQPAKGKPAPAGKSGKGKPAAQEPAQGSGKKKNHRGGRSEAARATREARGAERREREGTDPVVLVEGPATDIPEPRTPEQAPAGAGQEIQSPSSESSLDTAAVPKAPVFTGPAPGEDTPDFGAGQEQAAPVSGPTGRPGGRAGGHAKKRSSSKGSNGNPELAEQYGEALTLLDEISQLRRFKRRASNRLIRPRRAAIGELSAQRQQGLAAAAATAAVATAAPGRDDWERFAFQAETYLAVVEVRTRSVRLFGMLGSWTQDSATAVKLEHNPENESKNLTWRRTLLMPKFPPKESDFSLALQEWEADVDRYASEYGAGRPSRRRSAGSAGDREPQRSSATPRYARGESFDLRRGEGSSGELLASQKGLDPECGLRRLFPKGP
ncbi:RE2 [Symbiodinium sp. CCMP2592]|nr:RE2 [Symbiodinium sp. CCMP2592]